MTAETQLFNDCVIVSRFTCYICCLRVQSFIFHPYFGCTIIDPHVTLCLVHTGDLWGPLLVCLLLSTILSITAPGDTASMVFAAVFVIVWFGAAAVTVNAQLLGGTISFFQSVCILGYCVFPLTLSAMGCLIMSFIYKNVRILTFIVRFN